MLHHYFLLSMVKGGVRSKSKCFKTLLYLLVRCVPLSMKSDMLVKVAGITKRSKTELALQRFESSVSSVKIKYEVLKPVRSL